MLNISGLQRSILCFDISSIFTLFFTFIARNYLLICLRNYNVWLAIDELSECKMPFIVLNVTSYQKQS